MIERPMLTLDDLDLTITDEDLREWQKAWDAKFKRVQHPYVFDLIKVLSPYPKLKRTIALDWLHRDRLNADCRLHGALTARSGFSSVLLQGLPDFHGP